MSKTRTNKEKLYDIVKKPHITEKSMMGIQLAQYTFIIDKDATKVDVAQAIEFEGGGGCVRGAGRRPS